MGLKIQFVGGQVHVPGNEQAAVEDEQHEVDAWNVVRVRRADGGRLLLHEARCVPIAHSETDLAVLATEADFEALRNAAVFECLNERWAL